MPNEKMELHDQEIELKDEKQEPDKEKLEKLDEDFFKARDEGDVEGMHKTFEEIKKIYLREMGESNDIK